DQRIVNPKCGALIGGHRSMRHDAGMVDQALDAAETLGDREYPAALQTAARHIDSAANEEADDAAEPVLHLRARQRVLRMTWQPGIENALHLLVTFQPACNF